MFLSKKRPEIWTQPPSVFRLDAPKNQVHIKRSSTIFINLHLCQIYLNLNWSKTNDHIFLILIWYWISLKLSFSVNLRIMMPSNIIEKTVYHACEMALIQTEFAACSGCCCCSLTSQITIIFLHHSTFTIFWKASIILYRLLNQLIWFAFNSVSTNE